MSNNVKQNMNKLNIFNCCCKRNSNEVADTYVDGDDSIDNLSMISVTYGLESFMKNAVLIFCQVTSEQGNRDRDLALKEVAILKETFQKYRFEVEVHIDLTSSEVEQTCNDFFARDFSEYGTVAVIILSPSGEAGTLAARDQPFHESVVVKHLTTHVPITLRNKPKIYITEANRASIIPGSTVKYSLVVENGFEDVLGLHIPSVIEGASRSPIQIFCDRMNRSEDHGNLVGIVIGSIQDIEEAFPALKEKVELTCTFKKRFTLPMFVSLD